MVPNMRARGFFPRGLEQYLGTSVVDTLDGAHHCGRSWGAAGWDGLDPGSGTVVGARWALLGSYPEPRGLSSLGPWLRVLDPGQLHKPLFPGPEVTPAFSVCTDWRGGPPWTSYSDSFLITLSC